MNHQARTNQSSYVRVSTHGQTPNASALAHAGCNPHRIYKDDTSGVNADRPGLTQALSQLREGDSLVVFRLDRLGRCLHTLATLVRGINDQGAEVISLTEDIGTVISCMCIKEGAK